jgi:hypothetical protein
MENYVYIILDITERGKWVYNNILFESKPIYVGIGVGRRYKEHLRTTIKKGDRNYTKFEKIKGLILSGNTPTIYKIYENIDREDAKSIEKDIIKTFGREIDDSGILLNITSGGDETNVNKLGSENIHSKSVYQYTIDGLFLKKWGSLREVGRTLKLPYNSIGDCCRGKTKTSHGFQWSYLYKEELEYQRPREQSSQMKIVYKFDYDNILIDTYRSLQEAADNNKICKSSLVSSIRDSRNFEKYFYSYDKEFKINIKDISRLHKIEYNDMIYFHTNEEIMEIFNVSRYYTRQIKKGKIMNGKFKVINE